MKWLVIFEYQTYKTLGEPGDLNIVDAITFISMETGIGFEELLEYPVTVFKLLGDSIGKIYEEKNRQQKDAMRK